MTTLDSYLTLGRSGLRVSPLSLGTMTFGEDDGWAREPRPPRRSSPSTSTAAATSSTPPTPTPTAAPRRSSATSSPPGPRLHPSASPSPSTPGPAQCSASAGRRWTGSNSPYGRCCSPAQPATESAPAACAGSARQSCEGRSCRLSCVNTGRVSVYRSPIASRASRRARCFRRGTAAVVHARQEESHSHTRMNRAAGH
jgi:hypothetical protein